MPPKLAFSTLACPDWTWSELIRNATRYGYTGLEVRLLRGETNLLALPEFQPDQLAARRQECAALGLEVCGLSSSVRFDYAEPAQVEEQLGIGRRYLELAQQLDAGFVRVFGDVLPPESQPGDRQRRFDQIAAGLRKLGQAAREVGVMVLMETHGDFADSRLMQRMMQAVDHPAVGALWDTHHPWRFYHEPLAETWERLRPWTRHTHWKDSVAGLERRPTEASQSAEAQASQLMSGHKGADYVLFGGGEFPILECLRLLKSAGYDGWCSLEWEKAWHPGIEPPEIALPLFARKLGELWRLCAGPP